MKLFSVNIQAGPPLRYRPVLMALVGILSAGGSWAADPSVALSPDSSLANSGNTFICQQEKNEDALAEKRKAQEHIAKIESFIGTLSDQPKHYAARERATQALTLAREALAKIDERINLDAGLVTSTKQINETKRQLAMLGFDDRAEDFEQLGEISSKAQAHMKAQLIREVKELALSTGDKAMEDRFLEAIKTVKPGQVKALADKLRKAGVDNSIFQHWLRSFSPNASRKVLEESAHYTIKFLHEEEHIFEAAEKTNEGTESEEGRVEADQEATLIIVSAVSSEYPVLAELRAVAAGAYTMSESGIFLYVLNKNIGHLDRITEEQLKKQKKLIERMETLVKNRKQACADKKRLLEP